MKNIQFILTFLLLGCLNTLGQTRYATIFGKIDFLKEGDSVKLTIDRFGYPNFTGYQAIYVNAIVNHSFQFKIPSDTVPLRFHLMFYPKGNDSKNMNSYLKLNLNDYYMEDKDNIHIVSDKNGPVTFSGIGYHKLTINKELRNIDMAFHQHVRFAYPDDAKLYFEKSDSATSKKMAYLESQRAFLSKDEFDLLKADIWGSFYGKGNFLYMMTDSMRNKALQVLKDYKSQLSANLLDNKEFNTRPMLKYADEYATGIISKYIFDTCYVLHQPLSVHKCYDYIVSNYDGILRERLIVNLLYKYRGIKEDISLCVNDAFNYVHDKDFLNILQKLKSNRIKGAQAYNFTLPDVNGLKHSLSEYIGKVVFIDFWFTGCGNCLRVAPYLAKIEKEFSNKPVVFLSINLDNQKSQWINSVRSTKYSSKYSINLFTEGKAFRHPVSEFYEVDGGPTLIMIDKSGRLMNNPVDPRIDDGRAIIISINKELNKL
jgi:thiol-disulfide isomerase/thioredoxin